MPCIIFSCSNLVYNIQARVSNCKLADINVLFINDRGISRVYAMDFIHSNWRLFKIINETRISFGWFDLIWSLVFNATFSNISAISWRPVLVMERTTDHGQATGKLYHLRLLVECTLFVIYKTGRELMDNTPQMKTF